VKGKRRFVTLSVLLTTLVVSIALSPQALASPISEKKARLARVQEKLQEVYHRADIAVEK
jgi:hypothetical protein